MLKTSEDTSWRVLAAVVVVIAATLAGPGILCSVGADEAASSKEESGAAREARQALATILQLLQDGNDEQYFLDHAPGSQYALIQKILADGKPLPAITPPHRKQIVDYVRTMQQMDIVLKANGVCAAFVPPALTGDDAGKPEAKNLYAKMTATGIAGYGDQLPAVIKLALADLAAGESEKFAAKMFPPSTTAMIKTENRWDHVVKQLATGTAQCVAMQKDLQLIEALEPKIDGNTAIYTLDRIATAFQSGVTRTRLGAPRRTPWPVAKQPATSVDGKREIRFSLVDGHWRFYDNTSQLAARVAEALNQKMSEGSSPDDTPYLLIKLGKTWRLMSLGTNAR